MKNFEKVDSNNPEVEDYGFSVLEIKPQTDISVKEADNILKTGLGEIKEPYYVALKERLDCTPINLERGQWSGERGFSHFEPSKDCEKGRLANGKLAEFGLSSIEYCNGFPDFSPCAVETVQIKNMTSNRPMNFSQADKLLAEKFNRELKDGRGDWDEFKVEKMRHDNKLSWHEMEDTKTMQLVPLEIHEFFNHSGGIAECREREKRSGIFKGVKFDE